MAIHAPQLFLLAYDIANPKRLVKVHRQVSKRGLALQYSVFLLLDTPAGLDGLLGQLDRIFDGREGYRDPAKASGQNVNQRL